VKLPANQICPYFTVALIHVPKRDVSDAGYAGISPWLCRVHALIKPVSAQILVCCALRTQASYSTSDHTQWPPANVCPQGDGQKVEHRGLKQDDYRP